MSTDLYDSPWKDILDHFFQSFVEFFLPDLAEEIDWFRGYESLDKELNKLMRDQEIGRRVVDKLMKVWLKNGKEIWLLIHIEIQAQAETEFPERMFIYHYRLFDKYEMPITSVAILADDHPHWRPSSYEKISPYTSIRFNFKTIKLLDYVDQQEMLLMHSNPFAIVVWAHLKALETLKNPQKRLNVKLMVTKALYNKGYSKNYIFNLFRFIDWVLALPRSFEIEYNQELKHLEEGKMRYVTSIEEDGERNVLMHMLERRFGSLSVEYQQKISNAKHAQIIAWVDALMEADCLEEVF